MTQISFPFGSLLGAVTVDGATIDVFSNASCRHISGQKSLDDKGHYLGIQYQCVEFVRRYIFLRHGVNLAERWQAGDAKDWFDNRTVMGLQITPPASARPGDILTFTGGVWGHVGIVSRIDAKGGLFMTSQNFLNGPGDLDYALDENPLRDAAGNGYVLQSILRI